MSVNLDKPSRWKADIAASVDMYNHWFMEFAPVAFRTTRIQTTKDVEAALELTGQLTAVSSAMLLQHPEILPALRMSTCPPLAVDRLIGLARASPTLVKRIELTQRLPARMSEADARNELEKVATVIKHLMDPDIFVWLKRKAPATKQEIHRAATIVADRLCGAVANPIFGMPRKSGNSQRSRPGWSNVAISTSQPASERSSTPCRPVLSAFG